MDVLLNMTDKSREEAPQVPWVGKWGFSGYLSPVSSSQIHSWLPWAALPPPHQVRTLEAY